MDLRPNLRTLSFRLVVAFVVVTLVTLLVVGLAAWSLVRMQLAATEQARLLPLLAASTLAIAVLAGLLGYILSLRITAPLRELAAASERIGRGDFSTPVADSTDLAEVAALARALEHMRARLSESYRDLQIAKDWSENLIASLSEGVLTLNAEEQITSFSPGAERLLGWRATDVIGRPFNSLFGEGPGDTGAGERQPSGTTLRRTATTRDGRQLDLLITTGAVTQAPDGRVEQALVLRDVTQEQEALRLREFFLANVSHELKTPLTALRASVELLAEELPSLSSHEQIQLVNSLWLGTIRLQELVDNLLSSASISSGQFQVHLSPIDLASVVQETAVTTRPLLMLRGQSLRVQVEPGEWQVLADRRRLAQVLTNLISNSSKYGPPGRPIVIRAQPRLRQLMVQVIDEGAVPFKGEAELFEPFKRHGDAARGGVGLGLAIVKTIVERHGGEVGATSLPAKGTTFWFTLNLC